MIRTNIWVVASYLHCPYIISLVGVTPRDGTKIVENDETRHYRARRMLDKN